MKVNISIDDVSPHTHSGLGFLSQCDDILEKYPAAKFTLFVPLAYWRSIPRPPHAVTAQPLYLSQFPEFCDRLCGLAPENFEIGVHGYYHGIPNKSNNDEFRFMNYAEAMNRFGEISDEIDRANLRSIFKPIFRPAAYRMNPASISAARDSGFRILALSPNNPVFEEYGNLDVSDVIFYDSAPRDEPLEVLKSLPARDFMPLREGEELRVVYHACEWEKNYLNNRLTSQLISFLDKASSEPKFIFMEHLQRGNYGKI